jgi:hypothetical protein
MRGKLLKRAHDHGDCHLAIAPRNDGDGFAHASPDIMRSAAVLGLDFRRVREPFGVTSRRVGSCVRKQERFHHEGHREPRRCTKEARVDRPRRCWSAWIAASDCTLCAEIARSAILCFTVVLCDPRSSFVVKNLRRWSGTVRALSNREDSCYPCSSAFICGCNFFHLIPTIVRSFRSGSVSAAMRNRTDFRTPHSDKPHPTAAHPPRTAPAKARRACVTYPRNSVAASR